VCASYKVSDVMKKDDMCQPKPEFPPYTPYWSLDRHGHLQSAFISVVYNGLHSLFVLAIRERGTFSMADC